jgi:hypothetical protein
MEPLNRPIDDPFFAELRRRRPDIDIVLLPPESPPADVEHDAEQAAADALTRVAAQARQLWGAPPEVRFRFGVDESSVRPVATLPNRRPIIGPSVTVGRERARELTASGRRR